MTQDEIIEMAREVQKDCVVSEDGYRIWSYESLGRLIKLAAAKEREECAKVCDELHYEVDVYGAQCAAAIRARGQA
jgi:hypothetical protein